jgi:hypothetical protein
MPWVTTKFQDKVKKLQAVIITEAYHAGYCSAPSPCALKNGLNCINPKIINLNRLKLKRFLKIKVV